MSVAKPQTLNEHFGADTIKTTFVHELLQLF